MAMHGITSKIGTAAKTVGNFLVKNKKIPIPIGIAAGVIGAGAILKGAKKGEKLDTQA